MINWYINESVYIQVIIASLFTFFITALGSAIVFMFKKVNHTILDAMLGLSAGVMISASFWSLLNPAIAEADNLGMTSWLVVSISFFFGGLLLILGDIFFDKILSKRNKDNKNRMKRSLMLIFSITLHNIPEDCIHYVSQKEV